MRLPVLSAVGQHIEIGEVLIAVAKRAEIVRRRARLQRRNEFDANGAFITCLEAEASAGGAPSRQRRCFLRHGQPATERVELAVERREVVDDVLARLRAGREDVAVRVGTLCDRLVEQIGDRRQRVNHIVAVTQV